MRWRAHRIECKLGRLRNRRGNDSAAIAKLQFSGRRMPVQVNTLMCPIPASGVAKVATDARLRIDPRDNFVIEVEMLPFGYPRKALTAKVVNRCESFFVHPIA